MYSLFKLTHPATAVEHAVACYFFNQSVKCLVLAGKNNIKVFQLIPDVDLTSKTHYTESNPPRMKLECVGQYVLHGNIVSMNVVSLADSTRDALILSFKDAKLSIVEYDPESHDLQTRSLHYFEQEEFKDGWFTCYHNPIVRVDPENRCAVMLVYGRRIMVLPFRVVTLLEADTGQADNISMDNQVLSSYMIELRSIEQKIDNVIDVQFLHGYYEPTMLILYEPVKTFAGRIAVRKDTCAMIAVSLNVQQKVHPVIWSLNGLPFDCTKALPVPKPIGGLIVFAINSLIYLNQSIPPYGVAVNSLAAKTTSFPLKEQESVRMTLLGVQASFISHDKLILSLKNGELYVLTLHADSMRCVRGFHFEKSAASVLSTCTCVFEDNYLFLGSRLGNSLLLRFSIKVQINTKPSVSTNGVDEQKVNLRITDQKPNVTNADQKPIVSEVPSKRKKPDISKLSDWMASDVAEIRDVDELEVYGNEQKTSSVKITSLAFEVCDSLLNIGPCSVVSVGESAFVSEEFSNNSDPDIEMVTTSGYGKNGALCLLQRSIRPQVVTTFELSGYLDMWTIIGQDAVDDRHAYLLLTQPDCTMVLQTGSEINEVDQSGFSTDGPTVYAGNLGNNKYILQVTQTAVRLLQGSEQVQVIPLDLGSPLVFASSSDPHVIALTEDGQVILLTLREVRQGIQRLAVLRPTNFILKPQVTSIALYRDISGLLSNTIPETERRHRGIKKEKSLLSVMRGEIEDEDELLYGEAGPRTDAMCDIAFDMLSSQYRATPWWKKYMYPTRATYWLFVTRENFNLEIYSIPEFHLSYCVLKINTGLRILADSLGTSPDTSTPSNTSETSTTDEFKEEPKVEEITVVPLGHNGKRPVVIIRLTDEVLVYQAFRYQKGFLKVRFQKISTILTRDVNCRSRSKGQPFNRQYARHLRYFTNIAGYNGVFICGQNPHWLILTSKGELRTHPMHIDGPVKCLAPFQNVNCPNGFLYFNLDGELRICVLPIHVSYDATWPVRKVPLKCTAHFLTYHVESKTYCLVLSKQEYSNQYYRFSGEDKELSTEKRDERFPLPTREFFSIALFSPVSWEILPNTKMDLHEWEFATCLSNVLLAYEGTRSGLKGYIAMGTNYNYSEDITSRGRIIIYDIIEVVPEPGQPLTRSKIKVIYAKEQKGPVTAISHTLGFLITAIGQKIYIWQLKDNDLVGVAFIDTQIYTHRIFTLRSFIVIADVYKSLMLLRFQEEYRTLSVMSRDVKPAEVYSMDFLVDNSQLAIVSSDSYSNIVLHVYQPEARESMGGFKLLRKADIHIGQRINTFFRLVCRKNTLSPERRTQLRTDGRHVTMFATLDGAIGYIMPLPEKTYRRLLMLQNILLSHVPHVAGLNPKAFTTYQNPYKLHGNACRGILDGSLIWEYIDLPLHERIQVAKKIGIKSDEILQDLYEIEMLTTQF